MKYASLFFISAALLVSLQGFSADPPTTTTTVVTTTTTGAPKADWIKQTLPNDNHKALNDLVGKWNYTVKMWPSAEGKMETSKGTASTKWVLGGRFVQQDVKAKAMGQDFLGMGFTGYDNVKQEYQSVWMDTMSTAMMLSTGSKDAATGVLQENGTVSSPMTGDKAMWFRTDLKMISKNEHVFEMYSKDAQGKEFKTMEITYHRAKATR